VSIAAPAAAVDFITVDGAAGVFGNPNVTCSVPSRTGCAFTSSFTFETPANFRLVSASISSVMTGNNRQTDINFDSVTLNGVAFNILSTGVQEFRNLLNQNIVSGGSNTIAVSGVTGGDAAFSGNLSFAAGVPEPGTWAMMILGFGVIGAGLRRGIADTRQKSKLAAA
jgi:PEP-CTERM motif